MPSYVNDQNYQGYTEISLRSNFHDQAYLREITSYEFIEALDITAPQAAYGGVDFNKEGEILYTIVEHINEEFVEMNFDDPGLGNLVKARVGSGFNYMGDDPTAYVNTFELKTNENISDLHDLIEFLQFVEESSDEEFAEEIEDYLDLEQMLKYLVFCNVTVTMDSFPGNSNNYYFYQDSESDQFTLIPWDLNGAYGGFWNFGQSSPALLDIFFDREDFVNFPQKPNRPQRPINPDRELPDREAPGLMKMAPGSELKRFAIDKPVESGNPLVARLLENEEISEMYLEIYEEFMEEIFTKREVFERMNELSRMVLAENESRDFLMSGLEVYTDAMQEAKEFINQRIEFLDQELYNAGT